MIKFNPFTGTFDFVGSSTTGDENFSYKTVILSNTVTIPLYQQMIVLDSITVDGTLIIDGELSIIAS